MLKILSFRRKKVGRSQIDLWETEQEVVSDLSSLETHDDLYISDAMIDQRCGVEHPPDTYSRAYI